MSKGGFIERWSRRKLTSGQTQEAGPEPAEARGEPHTPAATEATPVTDEPAEATLDEAELARLPPIEDITVKTDLAPFLRKGVPQALKNAALRKMWMLDPAIRDHKDFAVDYAWDWNTPGGVPGNAGTISGKSLARMLDSLNPKPKEPAAAQGDSPAEPASHAAPEERIASAGPEVQSQAPAQTPPEAPDRGVSDAADATPADDRMARRRRHGGAAPV